MNEETIITTDCTVVPKEYFATNPDAKMGDVPMVYAMERFELVPYVGALTYIKNATYPRKSMPAVEILYSINIIKEIVKQSFKYPLVFLNLSKLLASFNSVFIKVMGTYRVQHIYMTNTSRMIWFGLSRFLQELGIEKSLASNFAYYLAHIPEIDDAYRHRPEDIFSEVDWVAMRKDPRKELWRVYMIYKSRENPNVFAKIDKMVKPLFWLLLIPKYKKAFIKACDYFENIKYDKSDWYWVAFKPDNEYNFGGKTHTERMAEGLSVPEMYALVK